jgi:hypothetical protein
VVRIVNHCFLEAIKAGASDIHVEPYEDILRVRFRIDGALFEIIKVPIKYRDGVISRIKVLSKLDISEKRIPQDGRIKLQVKVEGRMRNLDVRVSSTPTLFGEKIVMRLLDKEGLMLDMSRLGFDQDSLKKFEEAIFKPWGMVLVTGPTGSGKTNTLYSAITRLNTTVSNIMTVEDPIEFNIYGINQVQVHESIDLTFASVLRSFLRQDPNIILVGEIRDNETASIAVHRGGGQYRQDLRGQGMQQVQQHRLQRAHRPLRGNARLARHKRPHIHQCPRRGDQEKGHRRGHGNSAPERSEEDQPGDHHYGRSFQGNCLAVGGRTLPVGRGRPANAFRNQHN